MESLGLETSETEFETYTLPGGENYRELLLTLPVNRKPEIAVSDTLAGFYRTMQEKHGERYHTLMSPQEREREAALMMEMEDREREANNSRFTASHWREPNVLLHVRFNERTDADGKKVLFIEEIQSDFAQKYRRAKKRIAEAVDRDFDSIAAKMVEAGVIKKDCD
jgi:hypothetical protein